MHCKYITTAAVEPGLPLSYFNGEGGYVLAGRILPAGSAAPVPPTAIRYVRPDGSMELGTAVRVDDDFLDELWDSSCDRIFAADVLQDERGIRLIRPSQSTQHLDLALFDYRAAVPVGYRLAGASKYLAGQSFYQGGTDLECCLSVLAAMPDGSELQTVMMNAAARAPRPGIPSVGAVVQYGHHFVRKGEDWWLHDECNVVAQLSKR